MTSDSLLETKLYSVASLIAETEDVCGIDHSYDATVLNYKKICDGYLVSIIGCLGVLGKHFLKHVYNKHLHNPF